MHLTRRELMTSIAALTYSTQFGSSYANQENKSNHTDRDGKDLGDNWSNSGFIRIQTLTNIIQINQIILISTLAVHFIRFLTLGHRLNRTNENRVTIPKSIPLFGSLFKESYEQDDFNKNKKIGLAYTYDNSLILDLVPNRPQIVESHNLDLDLNTIITDLDNSITPVGGNFSLKIGPTSYSNQRLDILNDDFSYQLPTMEIKALSGDEHALTSFQNTPQISSLFKNKVGEVYNSKNLLVLIRPSIVVGD
ncbi:MAG: hypothetical protein V7776_18360 [Halopseudomonas aestusnigri]